MAAEIPAALAPAIARGLQETVEETVLALAGEGENLCLAGGLFFNALLVEFLERCGRWKNVFVQPRGGQLPGPRSARCITCGTRCGRHTRRSGTGRCCWVRAIGRGRDQAGAGELQAAVSVPALDRRDAGDGGADAGRAQDLAWMQGRMEFGPRALGNRSILASPLDPYSTENLNIFIKHREPFRKFAASVPAELAAEYFERGAERAQSGDGGPRAPEHRKTFESAILGGEEASGARAHGRRVGLIRCTTACCTKPGRRRGCRCSTTPASICSAIRWSRRRATRCGASIRRASTRCLSGNFLLEK